jgi:galactokinase
MTMQERIVAAFEKQFGEPPTLVVRAPGRVNLIGEHTDYNDGFVMPLAIDRAVWIALRPRTDRQIHVQSLDFPRPANFSLDCIVKGAPGWAEYVKGVAWVMGEAGHHLDGWEGMLAGDVPVGAGLSSSAALEIAVARAFAAISAISWEPAQMALIGQRAENEWVGMNCGIMDQMISAAGVAGHALLIDCRSLETTPTPLPAGTAVAILDTATRRGLVDSAYNERRAQCEAAARCLGVPALRDVTVDEVTAAKQVDPLTRRRALHVVTENARTLATAEAMQNDDPRRLGELMRASHASLRDDFEVSNDQLNIMVDIAMEREGCYGARMTGAGFGGCAVALIAGDAAEALTTSVAARYEEATGLTPAIYICEATAGADIVWRS